MIHAAVASRKNLMLLVAIVAMQVAQPLVGHRSVASGAFFDALFAAICLYLFFVVFEERWERRVACALLLPALTANFGIYIVPRGSQNVSAAAFHCIIVVFLGFAVAVVLTHIFRKSVIHGDDVLGACCGYMLAALVWANLYTLTYLLAPGAFSVKPELASRLGEWHQRRALFDYLSFTTLTSLGYSDIAPAGPPVYSLTWLEVMFGQFYIAVIVAQLVGLKLADAIKRNDPTSSEPRR